MKSKVLFVCIHNGARSQMAEAFLNRICSERFEAHSAGLEPGNLNLFVVEAMREIGIDISGNRTKSVMDEFKPGRMFEYIITVCDKRSAERCPIFPGFPKQLHWGFPDPSVFSGTSMQKLERAREIRELIKERIQRWCETVCPPKTGATCGR